MTRGEVWIFFFALGVLLFNWPFLTILEGSLVSGLFLLWGSFIALAALTGYRRGGGRSR